MSTFEKNGWKEGERQTEATFLKGRDVPIKGEPWRKLSIRDRCKVWSAESATSSLMPLVVNVTICVKLMMWAALFRYGVQDRSQGVFSDLNAKRFILYNVIGDILGTNSTSGFLGMRLGKMPFVSWWNFITPGTLTVPMVNGMPYFRSKFLVGCYLALLALLMRALFASEIGFTVMWPPILMLAIILPQDLVIVMSTRAEHYGYVMVCMLFPQEQCIFGWSLVQLALWTWAGVSKIGPWFKYVTANMMPGSVVMRQLTFIIHAIHVSDTDPSPTTLCAVISHFGTITELIMGVGCVHYPIVFVPLTVGFHLYIFSMFPFASVMEWNVVCILSCIYLFYYHSFKWIPLSEVHPCLVAFLSFVLVIVPIIGNIFPKKVPFLLSYRPYAGNWRFSFTVLTKKSAPKLKRLKTFDSPIVEENLQMLGDNSDQIDQWKWNVLGVHVTYPTYRPVLPCLEWLQKKNGWDTDEILILQQEGFLNSIYGWALGLGYYLKDAHFKAIQEKCQFDKGECYTIVLEPCSIIDHKAEWWVVDNAEPDKKVIHGTAPFSELEAHGLFMPISAIDKKNA